MAVNWNTIVNDIIKEICAEREEKTFILRDIFPYIPRITAEVGSIGKTPRNTISRVVNGLPTVTKYTFSVKNKCWIYTFSEERDNLVQTSTISRGERLISAELAKYGFTFEAQKRFKDLKYKGLLSFDFYLSELNAVIEFDGLQHFTAIHHFGGTAALEINKIRDTVKDTYCKANGIVMIRIRYDEYKKIPEIISNLWGISNLPKI